MDNQALQQIKEIVDRNDQVSIIVGRNPQLDDMAAALGLYLTLQAAGKKISVASVTEPLVEHASLIGIDKVATQLPGNGSGDMTVSFPYKDEGEIEKVSYTIENGFLNIIVKAGEQGLSFSEQDVRYVRGGNVSGLVFTVGVPRLADVANLVDEESVKNTTLINIDNKEQNENYGNVVLVSPRFSSISEQVADLLLSLGYDFDVDAAQNLLNGISAATNNFQNPNTSYLAFEIAAILLRKDAKRLVSPVAQRTMQSPQRPAPQRGEQNTVPGNQPMQQQKQNVNRQMPQQQRNQNQQNSQQPNEQRLQQIRKGLNNQQNPQRQPMAQPQQRPNNGQQPTAPIASQMPQQQDDDMNPPADWLTPKVYKGSTNI